MRFHDDQRGVAFHFDEIENAFDAGFLDLLRLAFQEDGQSFHLGLRFFAEGISLSLRPGFYQERNRFPNEIGDGFSPVAVGA